ncbi:MAG TPA: SLC13 family permease [Blastocatellia bacterium]|nr:SLC13 family permease [Blastocatellia bacterium]
MPDDSFNPDTVKAVLTLIILAGAVYGFISERLSPDLTAVLAVLALLLTGVLTPAEAFSGFSHPATVSVAAVLVLSAGIAHSGALSFLARRLLAPVGRWELAFTAVIMAAIALLSAFINNTAAVAVFIPVVLEVCRRTAASPGRVLMPMSHAATFGGMCTLIGTSTNLVAHEYALSRGLPGFSMFELGQVGLPMLFAGFAYVLIVGRWFLPANKPEALGAIDTASHYLVEFLVRPESEWVGKLVRPERFQRDHDVELVELVRNGNDVRLDERNLHFALGDSLRVRGPLEAVLKLAGNEGLELHRPTEDSLNRPIPPSDVTQEMGMTGAPLSEDAGVTPPRAAGERLPLAEVVVLTPSGLIGRTLKGARFAQRYDAVVLALRRRGKPKGRPSTTPLQAGDVLVVEGANDALKALAETTGFLVIGTPSVPDQRPRRVAITLATLAAVVTIVSFGVLPIVTAATAGCVLLMLTGCLRPREAYQAIDMSIVCLLAGSLALGAALEKTGITTALAGALAGLHVVASPFVVLVAFFLVALVVSEFMSNSGTVPLLAPIALSIAAKMGVNPMALLAAVTFGSSAAFAMPIGYQTSLMIYGPGGYRFRDFVRMGIALDLILAVLALLLIPRFWPLAPL